MSQGIVRDYTLQAGIQFQLMGSGSFFMIVESEFDVDVDILNKNSNTVTLRGIGEGFSLGPMGQRFEGIKVRSVSAQTLKIAITDDEVAYSRVTGRVDTQEVKASVFNTTPDVSVGAGLAAQVLAENLSRREALVSNLAVNASTIRVGGADTAAAEGIPVPPDRTITIAGTGALYVFNPDAGAQSVGLLEIED